MAEPLTRVDSAVDGLSSSPPKVKTENRVDSGIADVEESPIKEKAEVPEKTSAAARRKSSMVPGVNSIKELKENKTSIVVAKETLGTGWKVNTSPTTVEEKEILSKHLVTPPVRAIDLWLNEPKSSTERAIIVTARNRDGVTIKDALTAIYKHYKKKDDDELDDNRYLEGFEWAPNRPHLQNEEGEKEREETWDRLYVWFAANTTAKFTTGGKKKNKKGGE